MVPAVDPFLFLMVYFFTFRLPVLTVMPIIVATLPFSGGVARLKAGSGSFMLIQGMLVRSIHL